MPTPEMRQAMATAPLGDDVFGDDPMVNELERVAAARLGKEAAVFLPSGTMGNVVGVAGNTPPRGEGVPHPAPPRFLCWTARPPALPRRPAHARPTPPG